MTAGRSEDDPHLPREYVGARTRVTFAECELRDYLAALSSTPERSSNK